MVKGMTGAALLCLAVPSLWFHWGGAGAWSGAVVLIATCAWRRPHVALGLCMLTAFLLLRLDAEARHALPRQWQHREAPLRLCLDQPPKTYPDYQTFRARVLAQPADLDLRNLRATAPPEAPIEAGTCLEANVRLRQPLGTLIPGQFNPTRYYFSERIDALGTLTELTLATPQSGLATDLYHRVRPRFTSDQALGVWAALALGWSSALDPDLASLFNQNQIKHLVVVSGMHVGMVAAWALLLAGMLTRLPGLNVGRPAWLRFLFACGASGCFVMLTGFGFPGVRAWVMLAVPLVMLALGLRLGGLQVLSIAAVTIALMRPQAWLSSGAWLSFGLVWVLIRLSERWRSERLPNWRLAIRLQLGLAVLMIPVAALMGFDWHPLSIPINLVMIPLVTLLVLPWSLLILIAPAWSWIDGYQWAIGQGIALLEIIAPWHTRAPAWTLVELTLVCLGLLVLGSQLFSGLYRWLLAPLVVLVWMFPASARPPEEFRLTMLDVGHGEALVLQWPDETWLYDTAGQWSNGDSVAARRLAAWYRRRGIEPDGIIVSHSDIDHAGGAAWATQNWPDAGRWSGEPERVAKLSRTAGWRNCHRSTSPSARMVWLAVPKVFQTNNNDRSCVLAIPTSAGAVVITGDASRMVEYWLLQAYPHLFPARVQVIGHHGSQTSSAQAFLNASPDALFMVSSGDRASPRWPSPGLEAYLERTGQPLLNTARSGTLEVTVADSKIALRDWSSAYRRRLMRTR